MPSPSPAVLRDLIARVETATGPDDDLDKRLFACFWGWSYPIHGAAWIEFNNLLPDGGFTGSLDSALSLMERELPNWTWSDRRQGGRFWASLTEPSPVRPMPVIAKDGATGGLVLMKALLLVHLHQSEAADA